LLGEYDKSLQDFMKAKSISISDTQEIQKEITLIKKKKVALKNKEKKMYARMFKTEGKGTSDGWMSDFLLSMFTPGISSQHVRVLNVSFTALFMFLLIVILVKGKNANLHFYAMLALAIGLFCTIQWFLMSVKSKRE